MKFIYIHNSGLHVKHFWLYIARQVRERGKKKLKK